MLNVVILSFHKSTHSLFAIKTIFYIDWHCDAYNDLMDGNKTKYNKNKYLS